MPADALARLALVAALVALEWRAGTTREAFAWAIAATVVMPRWGQW